MEGFGTAVTVYLMARNDNHWKKEEKRIKPVGLLVLLLKMKKEKKFAIWADVAILNHLSRCGKCVGVCSGSFFTSIVFSLVFCQRVTSFPPEKKLPTIYCSWFPHKFPFSEIMTRHNTAWIVHAWVESCEFFFCSKCLSWYLLGFCFRLKLQIDWKAHVRRDQSLCIYIPSHEENTSCVVYLSLFLL